MLWSSPLQNKPTWRMSSMNWFVASPSLLWWSASKSNKRSKAMYKEEPSSSGSGGGRSTQSNNSADRRSVNATLRDCICWNFDKWAALNSLRVCCFKVGRVVFARWCKCALQVSTDKKKFFTKGIMRCMNTYTKNFMSNRFPAALSANRSRVVLVKLSPTSRNRSTLAGFTN